MSYGLTAVVIIFLILGGGAIYIWAITLVTRDKNVIFFVEYDGSITHRLMKRSIDRFTYSVGRIGKKENEVYVIDPKKRGTTKFPFTGPFRVTVPCFIFARNNPSPMDPGNVTIAPKGVSSVRLSTVVNDAVARNIVAQTGIGVGKKDKIPAWLISMVCVILVLGCLLLIYMERSQISSLHTQLNAIQKVIGK